VSTHIFISIHKMDSSNPVIPKDWVHLVRTQTHGAGKNAKRKAATADPGRNKSQKTQHVVDMPPESMQDACDNIMSAIFRAKAQSVDDVILNLDPILSNVAYKDLVENLFGVDSNCVAPVIPVVTKAYEESFMREAIDSKVNNLRVWFVYWLVNAVRARAFTGLVKINRQ
jgi:hypothetical protein